MAINVAFPIHRQIVRGVVSSSDKATVVSIYPRPINEYKHTLFPGHWQCDKGSYENPTCLVVGPSSWFLEKDEESPIIEVSVSAIQIAKSIVDDYCVGILENSIAEAQPGLFYLEGAVTTEQVKKEHKVKLDHVNQLQNNWYAKLARVADSLWARSNGNPIAISDDMRLAAAALGLEDKVWMQDFRAVSLVKCFACGNLRDPNYPICAHCKTVDQSHPKAKELKFAV